MREIENYNKHKQGENSNHNFSFLGRSKRSKLQLKIALKSEKKYIKSARYSNFVSWYIPFLHFLCFRCHVTTSYNWNIWVDFPTLVFRFWFCTYFRPKCLHIRSLGPASMKSHRDH